MEECNISNCQMHPMNSRSSRIRFKENVSNNTRLFENRSYCELCEQSQSLKIHLEIILASKKRVDRNLIHGNRKVTSKKPKVSRIAMDACSTVFPN